MGNNTLTLTLTVTLTLTLAIALALALAQALALVLVLALALALTRSCGGAAIRLQRIAGTTGGEARACAEPGFKVRVGTGTRLAARSLLTSGTSARSRGP